MAFKGFNTYDLPKYTEHMYYLDFNDGLKKVEFKNIVQYLKENKMTTTMTYHNKRDSKGRFSKITTQAPAITANPVTKKLVNHFSFIIDNSGSMQNCWVTAENKLREIVKGFATACSNAGQEFIADIWTFDYNRRGSKLVANQIRNAAYPIVPFDSGNTPLVSTVYDAVCHLETRPVNANDDNTYAVVVITDGQNTESYYPKDMKGLVQRLLKTGRWTFAFNGPRGCTNQIENHFGVRENINEWENTTYGTVTMAATNQVAAVNYVQTRSMGQTQSYNYYSIDASNIDKKDIKNLSKISPRHRQVEKECSISEFLGSDFQIGKGYYELTKKELIQDHKGIIIYDKASSNYYGDSSKLSVREFLGIPTNGNTKVDPFNIGTYKIFVQSTSDNRKLVRGTTLVWRA